MCRMYVSCWKAFASASDNNTEKIPDTETDAGDCCLCMVSFSRFTQELNEGGMLQGSQCALSFLVVQFGQTLLKFRVEIHPAAELGNGTSRGAVRKIEQGQIGQVNGIHGSLVLFLRVNESTIKLLNSNEKTTP